MLVITGQPAMCGLPVGPGLSFRQPVVNISLLYQLLLHNVAIRRHWGPAQSRYCELAVLRFVPSNIRISTGT